MSDSTIRDRHGNPIGFGSDVAGLETGSIPVAPRIVYGQGGDDRGEESIRVDTHNGYRGDPDHD